MRKTGYGLFALFAVWVMGGCAGSTTGSVTTPNPVVRFINASPNSVGLDLILNDTTIGSNVPYMGSSATFASVEQGDYDVTVQENADPSTAAIETHQLNRDQDFLAVAVGLVTPPNTDLDKRLRCTPFSFNRARPNGDKARLIVIHAYNRSVGNTTTNIDFQNPGDTPRFKVSDIPFGEGRELVVDAGTDTFVARRGNSELELTPQTTFTFVGGKIYAAVVSGVEDEAGSQAPQIKFIELQTR
jgi:hypothetical protein